MNKERLPLLSRVLTSARWDNWWSSKMPPLLAVAFATLLLTGLTSSALESLLAIVVVLSLLAWHAHVVNDFCDIESDARSGKPNRIAELPGSISWLLILGLPVVGIAVTGVWFGVMATSIMAANYAAFVAYSAPPARLKERRWWGVAADAVGAHVAPTLFVVAAMARGHWTAATMVGGAGAVGWAACAGVRGILVHQVGDRTADAAAGLTTTGTTATVAELRQLVLQRLYPAEVLSLIVFLTPLVLISPVLVAVLALFLAVEAVRVRQRWLLPLFESVHVSHEPYRPLLNNDLYELWLPLALALELARRDLSFVILPLFQVLVFLPGTRKRASGVWKTLRGWPPGTTRRQPSGSDGGPQVLISATYWVVNGVNVFSANLARGLLARGRDARILVTEERTRLISFAEPSLPKADDVPFEHLAVREWETWGAHWGELIRTLESRAPCVYIPNSDWRHSCVSPLLSDRVAVVGVVHSDDPLHYDHVKRLGRYWNAIVAVSETVAEKTRAIAPELSDRIITIPIGVDLPDSRPQRVRSAGDPLRLIYHGSLKKHQKRILDLPLIVEALAARDVAVRLTIAGGGPDEAELRLRCRDLVARGLMTFAGVVPHSAIAELLDAHDVYLLTSSFEGMPNALIEAMGHGTAPVISRVPSGPSELVIDGENGFLVDVGDVARFAACIERLADEPDTLARISNNAFAAVRERFDVGTMVARYDDVVRAALDQAMSGAFRRPRGELSHPPSSVDGVSVFPVDLLHAEPGIGRFPAGEDEEAFRARIRALPDPARKRFDRLTSRPRVAPRRGPSNLRVIVGVPLWTRSGFNVQSENLVRELGRRGMDARLLITEEDTRLIHVDTPRLSIPTDITVDRLPIAREASWGAHWGAMIRYLESAAPCVYFPTFDWRHANVSPLLSADVHIIGNAFASDAAMLEQAARLGAFWNAIVVPDPAGRDAVLAAAPELANRIAIIPTGARFPEGVSRCDDGVVRLLVESSPRLRSPVARAVDVLRRQRCKASVTIVEGEDEEFRFAPGNSDAGFTRQTWPAPDAVFEGALAMVCTMPYGGLSPEVLRAMAYGCVPCVVTNGELPLPIRDGENCILIRPGRADDLASAVASLASDESLRTALAISVRSFARRSITPTDEVVNLYLDLFDRIQRDSASGRFTRPMAAMRMPPEEVGGVGIFPVDLPYEAPGIGRFVSRLEFEAFERERGRSETEASTVHPGAHAGASVRSA